MGFFDEQPWFTPWDTAAQNYALVAAIVALVLIILIARALRWK